MSSQEEDKYVARFQKILESLEENALSYLFQRGVFQGDANYRVYEQRINDETRRDSIVKNLLRSDDKTGLDEDSLKQIAMLLRKLCQEASKMFLDIKPNSAQQNSVLSAVIALGFHLALIDRITAVLNFPSINDKAYWRLLSLKTESPSSSPQSQVKAKDSKKRNVSSTSAPTKPSAVVSKPQAPAARQTPRCPPTSTASPGQHTSLKNTKKNAQKSVTSKSNNNQQKNASPSKPEGPLKVMIRRVVREINNDSYDAVISALKDTDLMTSLYKTADDPISVKIIEVNSTERVVYLIKQKMGETEPVTFRLIRKLLTEMYPPSS